MASLSQQSRQLHFKYVLCYNNRIIHIILLFYSQMHQHHSDPHEQPFEDQQNHTTNNFLALKSLKQKEQQTSILRNRLKALEARNQHTVKLMQNGKHKLSQLTNIRQQINRNQREIQKIKQKIQKQIQAKKSINRTNKQRNIQKIKHNLQSISIKKQHSYSAVVQEQERNEKKITEEKSKEKQQKIMQHNKIISEENQAKGVISQYIQRKHSSIHEQLAKEKENYHWRQARKQKELHQLAKKQLELISKQSESQAAYKEMKNKLDTMLGKIRHEKKIKKQNVLGSVNREREPTTSFYGCD